MMEEEVRCDVCGELFFEDELQDGQCETCRDKHPTMDDIAMRMASPPGGAVMNNKIISINK